MGLPVFIGDLSKDFSTVATPLNELTKKGVVFKWSEAQENAFHELKKRLTEAPLPLYCTSPKHLRLNVMQVGLELEEC
jgi:hypothetical protein